MNASRMISKITIYLVGTLALGALVLSYDNLVGVASENGIEGWKSYIWPLLLDFALIVFSLTVVRNSLLGERQRWPWAMVGLFTLGTLGFNILHADHNWTSRIMAAVAPTALFLSFETLMSQLKSEVRRQAAINSLSELATQADELTTTIESLAAEVDSKQAKIDRLNGQIADLRKEKKDIEGGQFGANKPPLDTANEARQETINRRRGQLADLLEDNSDLTNAELADLLGVSVSTIKVDKRSLNGHGGGQ